MCNNSQKEKVVRKWNELMNQIPVGSNLLYDIRKGCVISVYSRFLYSRTTMYDLIRLRGISERTRVFLSPEQMELLFYITRKLRKQSLNSV